MEINVIKHNNKKLISEINNGDVFECYGLFYLKTGECEAFSFDSNSLVRFSGDERVLYHYSKLTIL